MSTKLQREVSKLVEANIIPQEVASNIRAYYTAEKANTPNRLFAIFGVLGSLLVGLGVILILAHNWDDFTKPIKTVLAFIPLVIGQLIVGYSILKKKGAAWREGSATFLFFAIGASISMVSQIYNIPGSMQQYLLVWIALAFPLVYLLKSQAAALLYMLFITIYACNVGYFNDAMPWWYLGMLAGVAPHYYLLIKEAPSSNITGIFSWAIPLSIVISLGAFLSGEDFIGFVMYLSLFGLFYNIGKLPFFANLRWRANGYLLLGSVGTIVILMFMSFKWMWTEINYGHFNQHDLVITFVLTAISIAVLGYLFFKNRLKPFNLFQYAFIVFGSIYFTRFISLEVAMILTNLFVLALGVFTVHLGARNNKYSILNYGLLIITVLITCRFFDTHISFVIRGLLFVAIGSGFFVANYMMYKKQNKQLSHE